MTRALWVQYRRVIVTALLAVLSVNASAQELEFHSELIQPYQNEHVHGSTIVELPNGDLLAGWFQGSGERWADDVQILGSRKKHGENEWSPVFVLADVKEFPDINPILFMDGDDRLWLMWYTVIANQWSTSLLNYKTSRNYLEMDGAPEWDWQENLLVKPGDKAERGILPGDSFVESVNRQLEEYGAYLKATSGEEVSARWAERAERIRSAAAGEDMIRDGRLYKDDGTYEEAQLGYPYFRRMGWQTRSKPVITPSGRMIVPLYSDGFGFSLMALTDDGGENWHFSEPLVGGGNIQPSIAITGSGELVAYMRDNGAQPKRLHVSRSVDDGKSWSSVQDSELPNPGSAADIVTLANGNWVLIYNDTERGRHSLAVSLSEDEGKTWPWKKHIELDESDNPASYHYPAIIQGADGRLHATYSYFVPAEGREQKTVKYATFDEVWIKGE